MKLETQKISIFSRFKDFWILLLGYKTFFFFRSLFFKKKNDSSKNFNIYEVRKILDKIKNIDECFEDLTCDFPNKNMDRDFKKDFQAIKQSRFLRGDLNFKGFIFQFICNYY